MKADDLDRARDDLREMRRWIEIADAIEFTMSGFPEVMTNDRQMSITATLPVRQAIVAAMREQADKHRQALVAMGVEVEGAATGLQNDRRHVYCWTCGTHKLPDECAACLMTECRMRHGLVDRSKPTEEPRCFGEPVEDLSRQGAPYEMPADVVDLSGSDAKPVEEVRDVAGHDYDLHGIRRVAERTLKANASTDPGAILDAAKAAPHLAKWVLRLTGTKPPKIIDPPEQVHGVPVAFIRELADECRRYQIDPATLFVAMDGEADHLRQITVAACNRMKGA
ncbi:hypothetical protein [Thalassobaculum sp.]|uniref:hypothetical protein n=1 Tax=Thalassobaculum sp. TaxID=2022740 RepID=UPI0032ED9245